MVTNSNTRSGWDYAAMALGLYHSDYYLKASHFNPCTNFEETNVSMDFDTSDVKVEQGKFIHLTKVIDIKGIYYGVYKSLDGRVKMIQLTQEAANKIVTFASSEHNQTPEIRCYLEDGVQKIVFLVHNDETPRSAFVIDKNNGDIQIKMGADDELNKSELRKRHGLLLLTSIPHIALSALNVVALTLSIVTFSNFWVHDVVKLNEKTNRLELKKEFGLRNGFYDTYHDISRIVFTPFFLLALIFAPVIGLMGAPMAGRKIYATSERFLYHQSFFAGCFQPNHKGYSRIQAGPFIIPFKNENDTKIVGAEPLTYEKVQIELITKAGKQDVVFENVPYTLTSKAKADQSKILETNQQAISQLIDEIHDETLALPFVNINKQNQTFFDFKLHDVVTTHLGKKHLKTKNLILRVFITKETHDVRKPPQDSYDRLFREKSGENGEKLPRTMYTLELMGEKIDN